MKSQLIADNSFEDMAADIRVPKGDDEDTDINYQRIWYEVVLGKDSPARPLAHTTNRQSWKLLHLTFHLTVSLQILLTHLW
jgi:hypothetical protein